MAAGAGGRARLAGAAATREGGASTAEGGAACGRLYGRVGALARRRTERWHCEWRRCEPSAAT